MYVYVEFASGLSNAAVKFGAVVLVLLKSVKLKYHNIYYDIFK